MRTVAVLPSRWLSATVILILISNPLAPAVIVVDGNCTLVDAITAANTDAAVAACTAGAGADEIQLTVDVTLTQVASTDADGDNGLPLVSSVITVEGNAHSILRDQVAPAFRIFNVTPAGELVLRNTTVGGGVASPGVGGGILNRGVVTLDGSTLTGNRAANGGGGYNEGYLYLLSSSISGNQAELYDQFFAASGGGGIMNVASLESIDSTISGNTAVASGYYSYATGGGIQDSGTLLLYGGTVSDNVADAVYVPTSSGNGAVRSTAPLGLENWAAGGGIFASGTAIISNVMIAGNESDYFGGGLSAEGTATLMDSRVTNNDARAGGGASARNGALTIISSTIDGNYATISGGGLYTYFGGTVNAINSTVSGNSTLGRGGGLKSYGQASLTNSTVTGNSALSGGGIWSSDATELTATLIANSLDGGNCALGIDDLGNNFADDDTCGTVPDTLTGLDPVLADNGGPTPTHALLAGSTAIDAAGDCGLQTDQRGFSRSDGACDSGSFEFGAGQGLLLAVSGVCPGVVTIEVSSEVAGQSVFLFAGSSAGTFELPGGPCAGTELDMANARFVRELITDGSGFASLTREFRPGFCGRLLQAVDESCGTSNVGQFP